MDGLTQFYPPQHSDQVIAGIEWQRGRFKFLGDGYYKRYGAQKERFENIFTPSSCCRKWSRTGWASIPARRW